MKLAVWNIGQGGGSRTPRIVEELSARDADVIALAGYRAGTAIDEELRGRGWPYVATSGPAGKENGIAVFAGTPVGRVEARGHRWLEVELEGFGIWVLLLPAATNPAKTEEKRRLWDEAVREAEARRGEPWLLTGSWNTGAHRVDEKGRTYVCAEQFGRLSELGWVDAWRKFHPGETEWTWYSNQGNGFRVDHAFASPALVKQVRECRYSHREREAKLSDHSMVLVEVG
jgi:exonuclease III